MVPKIPAATIYLISAMFPPIHYIDSFLLVFTTILWVRSFSPLTYEETDNKELSQASFPNNTWQTKDLDPCLNGILQSRPSWYQISLYCGNRQWSLNGHILLPSQFLVNFGVCYKLNRYELYYWKLVAVIFLDIFLLQRLNTLSAFFKKYFIKYFSDIFWLSSSVPLPSFFNIYNNVNTYSLIWKSGMSFV